ncbi:hypothetical protein BGX31_005946 [Mortierella sp. GBA43]|nr:hypothetical protein BGX31_005946 [Mortierella sp. GBA43]
MSYKQVSPVQLALDCPEILHAIGEWILVDEWKPRTYYQLFKPQTMASCCRVSRFWRAVMTPLLWSVDDAMQMRHVPVDLLKKYSQYTKIFVEKGQRNALKGLKNGGDADIKHTNLRHLTIELRKTYWGLARKMVSSNMNLVSLELSYVSLYEQWDGHWCGESRGSTESVHKTQTLDHGVTSFRDTHPLAHLSDTLQELTLRAIHFEENEFYYLLRDVAKGSLRSLTVSDVKGSFELQDIVFTSLTQYNVSLGDTMQPGLLEIIGRSPYLEHLELRGGEEKAFSYQYELLTHFLQGTQQDETPCEREQRLRSGAPAPRSWFRPQLSTFHLYDFHLGEGEQQVQPIQQDGQVTVPEEETVVTNHDKYLNLIRICSNSYNVQKSAGHVGCLRELTLSLWDLDDVARKAIEVHSSSLETLKIQIEHRMCDKPSTTSKAERHGRVLRQILRSCRGLKTLEYWDRTGGVDAKVVMTGLMGTNDDKNNNSHGTQPPVIGQGTETWSYPELESLVVKSYNNLDLDEDSDETRQEPERLFLLDETKGKDAGTWVMPSFDWDTTLQDGTGFLLDTHQDKSTNLSGAMEGQGLVKKFLRYLSPSRRLKKIQLGQLQLARLI